MNHSRFALLLLTGGLWWCWAGAIQAQSPLPIRDRPTLSPWLNLNRRDPGPVGPYLSYVRPEQRLLSTLSQQRVGMSQQGTAIRHLEGELSQTGPQTSMAPTGTGAGFMNYNQFFNTQNAKGPSTQASRRSWTPPPVSHGNGSGF